DEGDGLHRMTGRLAGGSHVRADGARDPGSAALPCGSVLLSRRSMTHRLRAARDRLRAPADPEQRKRPGHGRVTWPLSEPPSGFEPETYALRVRCSGHLS